jgi:PAS domain S-box-containing protein
VAQLRQSLLPLLVLLAATLAGLAAADWLHQQAQARADSEFRRLLERTGEHISERLRRPAAGLHGAGAVFMSRADLTHERFSRFVDARQLAVMFQGVRGFGYVEPVQRADAARYEQRVRASGQAGFGIRDLGPGQGATRYVVRFIEPMERNAAALGVDLGSEPVRADAIARALESDQAVTSEVLTLVQDAQQRAGLLVVLALRTPQAGQPEPVQWPVAGLVYAPIVLEDLLGDLPYAVDGQVVATLYDNSGGRADGTPMFRTTTPPAMASALAPRVATTLVTLPGRTATLQLQSTQAFESRFARDGRWLVRGLAILSGLMLAALLWQQTTGRQRADARARRLMVDLERLALVAKRTSNAVVITDARRRIEWVNDGFERLTGYSAAEALGRHPSQLLDSSVNGEATLQALRTALKEGRPYSGEIQNRRKRGELYWLSLEIQPLLNDAGVLTGFMAIELDITDRKRAEAELRHHQDFLAQTGRIGGVGGWQLDLATELLTLTEETHRICGLAPGRGPSWREALRLFAPVLRSSLCSAIRRCVEHNQGFDLEGPLRDAQGRTRWVRMVGEAHVSGGQAARLVGAMQDITDRRQLQAEAKRHNELLQTVIDSLPCGLTVFDAELRLVVSNQAVRRLLDLPAELMDTPQVGFADLAHYNAARGEYGPGDPGALAQQVIERARRAGGAHQLERVRPDGTVIEIRGAPMPGGGFITTYADISDRRRAEEAARRSAALLEGAIEAIDEAFVLFDPQDRLVLCNERYKSLYARVIDMIKPGVLFADLVRAGATRGDYPQARGRIDDWVAGRVRAHHAANSTVTQHLASGQVVRIIERRLPDGHIVGFRIDITELHQARESAEAASKSMAQTLARLQAIYDILPVGITITDAEGHIIDCNPASELLLGTSKAEHLARDYSGKRLTVLREDGSPMPSHEYPSVVALTQGRPVHDAVMQVVRPDRSVWLSVSAMPAAHRELGVVVAYVDISEQRAQQAALAQAKALAEQASVAKSQFLANMSHEIRTPMNAILGMLALMKRTGLNAHQADYTLKTENAARSLLGLLNDILDFSKVEAGKMTLDPQPFAVEQLLQELGVILSSNLGTKPVELVFDLDHAVPATLTGDAQRLQQVLVNLAGNAVKFTSAGEVVVSVRLLALEGPHARLRFAVRDTGIGIAAENQQKIFSGFTQAEATTTRRFGGTGLGVAISQRLVALMGGRLQLNSVLGRGSSFHFELSLPLPAPGAAVSAAQTAAPLPAVRRALVVDDHAVSRQATLAMCRALGWPCDSADSGAAAVLTLQRQQQAGVVVDVVFIDADMPGLDGVQTAARVRSLDLAPEAMLVLMTTACARDGLGLDHQSAALRPDACVFKPLTVSMLLEGLQQARQQRARGPLQAAPGPGDAAPTATAQAAATALRPPTAQRLAGLRILVVEDNVNNQQVAQELLQDEGATVLLAGNGQQGLDVLAAARPGFDAVLMDLQMPVMDGYTATAAIRAQPAHDRLPIIAMTANAMSSDRQACLAAGMTEHIGKPFDLDHLVRTLLKLCGRNGPAAAMSALGGETSAALSNAARKAAGLAGVDVDAALARFNHKLGLYTRMLRGLVLDLQELPPRLLAQAQAGDLASTERTLHTLKGLAATLGARGVAGQAQAAERQLEASKPAAPSPAQVNEWLQGLAAARPGLEALLASLHADDAGEPVPADIDVPQQAVRRALGELLELLRNSDMQATERLSPLLRQAGSQLGERKALLEEAVMALEFERAAELCQTLLQEQPA